MSTRLKLGIVLTAIAISSLAIRAQPTPATKPAKLAGSYAGGAGQAVHGEGTVDPDMWDLAQMKIGADGSLEWRVPVGDDLKQYQRVKLAPPSDIQTDRLTWRITLNGRDYEIKTIPFGKVLLLQLRITQGGKMIGGRQEFYSTPE